MKCAICHLTVQIYEFDMEKAFKALNPMTFRIAIMHSDCYIDAVEFSKETEAKNPIYANRYDEFITKKILKR